MSMFQYIAQHPWIGAVLVLLIALTVFVWYKAIVSGKKRNEERERIIADLEREKGISAESLIETSSGIPTKQHFFPKRTITG